MPAPSCPRLFHKMVRGHFASALFGNQDAFEQARRSLIGRVSELGGNACKSCTLVKKTTICNDRSRSEPAPCQKDKML